MHILSSILYDYNAIFGINTGINLIINSLTSIHSSSYHSIHSATLMEGQTTGIIRAAVTNP